MAHNFQLIFNCTPTQYATLTATTLPAMGFSVIKAPIQAQGLIKSLASFTFTADLSSGDATLDTISSEAGLYIGIPISGTGIPANTTLATLSDDGSTGSMSHVATADGTAVVITAVPSLGQLDFSYDGKYFVRFYGANPVPLQQQPNPGVVENQMSTNLVTVLTEGLAETLGAPVPSNLANVSSNANNA